MYRRKDSYYQRAKAAGYRSRAAYKLLELSRRYRLLRKRDRVIDLGCWPGGWLQVAADAVGAEGRVVGVDLVQVKALPQPWVEIIRGDVADENVRSRIRNALGGPGDVVLSDMAPKLSGIRDRDEARAMELGRLSMSVAEDLLRPGGRMAIKVFANPSARNLLADMHQLFDEVKSTRPDATRKSSAELYVIALGFRGKHEP